MTTIGFATIAESPRDDLVPDLMERLPFGTRAVERGCLDALSLDGIRALAPAPGEVGIVSRLKSGGSTLLSHDKILPIMQDKVDELVREEGADLIVILCGADWSAIRCDRLVVNPGRLFPAVVSSLAYGRRLGVIKPDAGQVARERQSYTERGIDAVVTSASPYVENRVELARAAASELRDAGCDLVWMTCVGMKSDMYDAVVDIVNRPVLLARSVLAGAIEELLPRTSAVPA